MRKSLFYNLLVISLLSFSACSGGDKSKEENLIQEEVEVAINDFLDNISGEVIDIKYQVSMGIFSFSLP